jgi:molecular chaperone DnaK (HSP70)
VLLLDGDAFVPWGKGHMGGVMTKMIKEHDHQTKFAQTSRPLRDNQPTVTIKVFQIDSSKSRQTAKAWASSTSSIHSSSARARHCVKCRSTSMPTASCTSA